MLSYTHGTSGTHGIELNAFAQVEARDTAECLEKISGIYFEGSFLFHLDLLLND